MDRIPDVAWPTPFSSKQPPPLEPEHDQDTSTNYVLGYVDDYGLWMIVNYDYRTKTWHDYDGAITVTHWLPLPPTPSKHRGLEP